MPSRRTSNPLKKLLPDHSSPTSPDKLDHPGKDTTTSSHSSLVDSFKSALSIKSAHTEKDSDASIASDPANYLTDKQLSEDLEIEREIEAQRAGKMSMSPEVIEIGGGASQAPASVPPPPPPTAPSGGMYKNTGAGAGGGKSGGKKSSKQKFEERQV